MTEHMKHSGIFERLVEDDHDILGHSAKQSIEVKDV